MDLDQAVHTERRSDDGYHVHYAIADVAAFVEAGGAIEPRLHGAPAVGNPSKMSAPRPRDRRSRRAVLASWTVAQEVGSIRGSVDRHPERSCVFSLHLDRNPEESD
jgi:hypothetical protein